MPPHSATAGTLTDVAPGLFVRSRHAAILLAAKDCFVRKGFEASTLADVAKAARVSEEDLKQAYGSKHKLLLAIFDEAWSLINPRIADIIATSPDARSAMTSILSIAVNVYRRDRGLVRLMLLEGYRPQPANNRVAMSRGAFVLVEMLTALAERGQREGTIKASFHPRVVASLVLSVANGMIRDALIAEEAGGSDPFALPQLVAAFEGVVSSLKP